MFNPELDAWLNPLPVVARQDRPLLDAFTLRERALALVPRGMANSVSFRIKPDEAYAVLLDPRIDPASGKPYDLGFSMLYLDPYSGAELGRREYSEDLWPITRQNFMPLVNRLHFELAIPGRVGGFLLGLVALAWTVDCFVSGYLTFPISVHRRSSDPGEQPRTNRAGWWRRWWNPSWLVKWNGSALRVNFDLHRAGGLWVWILLLAFAWSSVGFNLSEEVYRPAMKALFKMPDPFAQFPKVANPRAEPGMGFQQAYVLARRMMADQAQRNGFIIQHEDSLTYMSDVGAYMYAVRSDRDLMDHGAATYILFDAFSGSFGGINIPTGANAGSTVDSWIFAVHMAEIWGLPFRIVVAFVGLLVVMLSITGIYIWWKKLSARRSRAARTRNAAAVTSGSG